MQLHSYYETILGDFLTRRSRSQNRLKTFMYAKPQFATRFELGSQDSEFRVPTNTPWNISNDLCLIRTKIWSRKQLVRAITTPILSTF
jgi:hypothetical protein